MHTNETFSEHNRYTVIQCIGYLKCWNTMNNKIKIMDDVEDASSVTCLVAIGRPLYNVDQAREIDKTVTFISKHAMDGKFIFVDNW